MESFLIGFVDFLKLAHLGRALSSSSNRFSKDLPGDTARRALLCLCHPNARNEQTMNESVTNRTLVQPGAPTRPSFRHAYVAESFLISPFLIVS